MQTKEDQIQKIWSQNEIPVIFRSASKKTKLMVKLPFSKENRKWLSSIGASDPVWMNEKKYWALPKAWFNKLVESALKRHGKLYVIQPYREQEICARACMEAQGHECNCSCMGANHGSGFSGRWFEVSDTFATRWKDQELACRLMVCTQT